MKKAIAYLGLTLFLVLSAAALSSVGLVTSMFNNVHDASLPDWSMVRVVPGLAAFAVGVLLPKRKFWLGLLSGLLCLAGFVLFLVM